MAEPDEDLKFSSYNAMGRTALPIGVPLFPLILCILGFFVSGLVCVWFLGWWGVPFPCLFIIAILAMRVICERDDKALRRVGFMLSRIFLNIAYGKHLLITPRNPKWSQINVKRQAKKRILARK